MRSTIIQIIAAGVAVLLILFAMHAQAETSELQAAIAPQTAAEVTKDTLAEIRPVVSVEMDEELTAEDEETILLEDDRIEAALLEQGYYRTDIPLTFLEQDFLHTSADEFGVPYELAVAVIWRETTFRNIVGDDGASVGYMQVQERWHRERMERLGVTDLTDPYGNFRVGCSYLGELLEKYGDTHKALMAYNMGPTSAAKLWRQGVTTSQYSRAVIDYMEGRRTQ